MYRVLGKALLLLAGSGLSHKEIRELVGEMQNLPPSQLADAILHLRRNALDPLEVVDAMLGGGRKSHSLRKPHRPSSDVRSRVEVLLKEEAGLTVKQAALELLASLRRERPGAFETVGPPNKESLYRWLQRVLPKIGPSELLHHATLVRNKYVRDTDSDWPLLPR